MEKFSHLTKSDRGDATPIAVFALGVAAMAVWALATTNSKLHQAEKFSEQVQRYNPQLAAQLQQQYDPLNDLVIKDGGKQFTFHTQSDTHVPLSCEGTMKIEHNTATAVGAISCTQSVLVTH